MERKLVAILAADVVGYSRLMGVDEEATHSALAAHRRDFIDPKILEYRGRIIGLAGDGALVEFASLVDAVRCAVEVQNGMARRNADIESERRIVLRIGINLGDVVVDGNDIYGDGVNIAARLEGLAEPGGICISGHSHDMIEGRLDMPFRDLGLRELKNINRPIRVWAWGRDAKTPTSVDHHGRSNKTSIVVLPFINISGDAEQDYFADGITADISTDLTKVSDLFVLAHNSALTYKGKSISVKQVSNELGVRYALEGGVRKVQNRVRITAQLIDGKSGGQVWADRYDRDLTDIFAVQDEIAHSIVDALRVRLLTGESRAIRKVPTTSIEAYQFYLRGRQFLSRHSTKSYEYAHRMFQRAIQLDPGYAQAYAGIADCDAFRCLLMHSEVSLDYIIATSGKALDLDPGLAEAHASRSLALSLGAEHEAASEEFDRAICLNPDLYEAHYFYARSCVLQGKHEEAVKHYKRAAEVAPDDFQSLGHLAQEYHALKLESAALQAERSSFERAERELARHPDNTRAACYGAVALVYLGDLSHAREWAERALWLEPDDPQVLYNVACVHARLGAHDKAFELLAGALKDMHPRMAAWARNDDDFASMREDPRFEALLDSARHRPAQREA